MTPGRMKDLNVLRFCLTLILNALRLYLRGWVRRAVRIFDWVRSASSGGCLAMPDTSSRHGLCWKICLNSRDSCRRRCCSGKLSCTNVQRAAEALPCPSLGVLFRQTFQRHRVFAPRSSIMTATARTLESQSRGERYSDGSRRRRSSNYVSTLCSRGACGTCGGCNRHVLRPCSLVKIKGRQTVSADRPPPAADKYRPPQ